MLTRERALRHSSPALWGLIAACVAEVAIIVGWNVYDRREAVLRALKL